MRALPAVIVGVAISSNVPLATASDDPDVTLDDYSVTASLDDRLTANDAASRGNSSSANASYEQTTGKAVRWTVRTIDCQTSWAYPGCGAIRFECTMQGNGEPPRIFIYTLQGGGGSWTMPSCSAAPPPPPALDTPQGVQAPTTPSLAQIQQAFRELPFCKPSPTIQPVGGKTLINLPTYYQASWPTGDCLKPGETSEAVKLLSWSIEFEVEAKDYRYSYGDGETSGWTTSTGGAYPDGDITHEYTQTGTEQVKVDARLTGSFRVNGGEWHDIDTVADLQDEPATTLEVVATRTRLHAA